jgi:Rrf2 family protein
MKVSVKCEYALRAVLDLAVTQSSNPVRILDIARRQNIPQKFLETILSEMKKDGLLESRRGAEGGYLLARPAEMITVGEVLRSVEGGRTGRLAPDDESPLRSVWRKADEAVAAIVDRTTFADLARQWREDRAQSAPNWEI